MNAVSKLSVAAQNCAALTAHPDIQACCQKIVASQTMQIAQMQAQLQNVYGISSSISVPKPASAVLLATGLLGLGLAIRAWVRTERLCPESSLREMQWLRKNA